MTDDTRVHAIRQIDERWTGTCEGIKRVQAMEDVHLLLESLAEAQATIQQLRAENERLQRLINDEAGISDYHASRATLNQYEEWLKKREAERDAALAREKALRAALQTIYDRESPATQRHDPPFVRAGELLVQHPDTPQDSQ